MNANATSSKFYSVKAIDIATFLGGPLAAGILLRSNFKVIGENKKASQALQIGIGLTILILVLLFSLPEQVVDKIPSAVLPAIYTAIVHFIAKETQGDFLTAHKEQGGSFFSIWKSVGIGLLSCIVLMAGIVASLFLSPNSIDFAKYDKQLAIFSEQEMQSMEIYELLEANKPEEAIHFLQTKGIPLWEENSTIIQNLLQEDQYPEPLLRQLRILEEYTELQQHKFRLMEMTLTDSSKNYVGELEVTDRRIQEKLTELESVQ